jgi:hypothetical protein
LSLSPVEQQQLHIAVEASQRKLVIEADTPQDIYRLLKDLRDRVNFLTPVQIRMMRDLLGMREVIAKEQSDPTR